MAKAKKPLIKSKQVGPLIFAERKNKKDGFTHNVRTAKSELKKK